MADALWKNSVLWSIFAAAAIAWPVYSVMAAPSGSSGKASPSSQGISANETREIPLNEIWALEMPCTKDVRELEPDYLKQHLSIRSFLKALPLNRSDAVSMQTTDPNRVRPQVQGLWSLAPASKLWKLLATHSAENKNERTCFQAAANLVWCFTRINAAATSISIGLSKQAGIFQSSIILWCMRQERSRRTSL